MAAGLETFAKVRALHDRTDNPGEKAAAAGRMRKLAKKAGMTVEQAVSKLDTKPAAPRNFFEELFNTPEFRAQRAEREHRYAELRIAALAEYGSEDAVWALNERERALEQVLAPLIVRKPIIGGDVATLQGWDGGRFSSMPPDVQAAVATAYPAPASVQEAWAEFWFWDKIADDRTAFFEHYDHDVRVRTRTAYVEHLLDTLPARSMNDLRARLDWMQHINRREWNRGNPEDAALLAILRADIERMGARLREAEGYAKQHSPSGPPEPEDRNAGVQNGQGEGAAHSDDPSLTPCRTSAEFSAEGSPSDPTTSEAAPVQNGHVRRTNAEKRAAVIALSGQGLTDREIARRAGVSPQTVGNIRKA